MQDPNRFLQGNPGVGGAGFNSFGAGDKVYGMGRSMPNLGPVGDRSGYAKRDREVAMQRNALLRKLQANFQGRPASPDALRQVKNYSGN